LSRDLDKAQGRRTSSTRSKEVTKAKALADAGILFGAVVGAVPAVSEATDEPGKLSR
jgi:hypothetical protein